MTSEKSATIWLWAFALITLFSVALAITSCASCGGDSQNTSEAEVPEITGVCRRAFPYVLEAWEEQVGVEALKEECRTLDTVFNIVLQDATSHDLAQICNFGRPLAENEKFNGCTRAGEILLRDQHDDLATKDSAVHEWVHAISNCVYGDLDSEHTRPKLWADYGISTVEAIGAATSLSGKCLP